MTDSERAEQPLKAVHVACNNDGDEYYEYGKAGVTDVKWGWTNGSMSALLTVQVFVCGKISSEHVFVNVLGVTYA